MKDYLAMDDEQFARFAATFDEGIGELAATLGIAPEAAADFAETLNEFKTTAAELTAARTLRITLTAKKNAVRERLKRKIRRLAAMARANQNVGDVDLTRLGLKIHDRTRTARRAPESTPQVRVEIRRARQHIIRVFDMANLSARAKPAGASGAEIWVGIGAGDADGSEWNEKNMRYLGTATRGRLAHIYDAADAGKQAFYMARWVSGTGKRGGWSRTTSATIAV